MWREGRAEHRGSFLGAPVVPGLLGLSRDMDRLVENVFGLVAGTDGRSWVPPVDIWETDDALVIAADLPGVRQEDVHISVQDGTLTLQGERKDASPAAGESVLRRERVVGPFVRHLLLPVSVDPAGVKATDRDGVLTIRAPKKEEAKPRTIAIDVN